jgi:neutral ceramidase
MHDRLECAALFVGNGAGRALFLANDLIAVSRPLVAEARRRIAAETGIPAENVMITATHTHSGPVMTDHISNAADPVVPKPDAAYLAWVVQQMTAAAKAAVQSAQAAEIGLVVARVEGVGGNRHDPAGPTDAAVPVLSVRATAAGLPIACMLVYGMHPTVLHEDSRSISGDFPHFARAHLRATVLPADCPVLYHNGASGDQSPRHFTRANTLAEAKRLGGILGGAIAAAMKTMAHRRDVPVAVRRTHLELEPRDFPTATTALEAVLETRARFERLRRAGAPRATVRTAECDVFGAEETAELASAASDGRLAAAIRHCSPAEIQVIEIGPWRFVGWPGEFFVEYALALKARAFDTFLITLANGELQGYIVTPEADARGVYEARNAVFAPTNGAKFVAATLTLLGAPAETR